MTGPLVEVEDLVVTSGHGQRIIDRVSLTLDRRSRTGLIGESGSGKSITALSILGLLPDGLVAEGRIAFAGKELTGLSERQMCAVRGNDISMIFQEPMTALNPVMRVGRQVAEALRRHQGLDRSAATGRVLELFTAVGIPQPERRVRSYPHQLSGGQRQRVMIAMALACGPDLVIADEPTTALDVTIQAQVLDVLTAQVADLHTSLLLITHDLPVVARTTERVLVMHDGRILETGPTTEVFATPSHSYTRTLVDAVPPLSRTAQVEVVRRERRASSEPAIVVDEVTRVFPLPRSTLTGSRDHVVALDAVSLTVETGETFGIVGESGSGKSTLARLMIDLDTPTSGTIAYPGFERANHARPGPQNGTVGQDARNTRASTLGSWVRRSVQMVFQDPMGSLDPRLTVLDIIAEPLRSLGIEGDHPARVRELLDAVDLPPESARRYPHEFSGGQRQRIAIARALAPHPSILIADEPVSALDMSVQTRTLALLADLKERFGLTMVFISHDLSVVHEICDRVAVLQDGRLVELGGVDDVFVAPGSPYTRRLIEAIPRLDGS